MHVPQDLVESVSWHKVAEHADRQASGRLQNPVVVDTLDMRAENVCDQEIDDNEQLVRLDRRASSQPCLDLAEALHGN